MAVITSDTVPPHDAHEAVDAVFRVESARLIAGLMRLVRDLGLAEDLAQRAAALDAVRGPDILQTAIAGCHARAATPADTPWQCIVALYGALADIMPSPVVELNRAVANLNAR